MRHTYMVPPHLLFLHHPPLPLLFAPSSSNLTSRYMCFWVGTCRPDSSSICSQMGDMVRDIQARLEDKQLLHNSNVPSAKELKKEHMRALQQQVLQHMKLKKRCEKWLKEKGMPTPVNVEEGELKGKSKLAMFGSTITFAEEYQIITEEEFEKCCRCNDEGNRAKYSLYRAGELSGGDVSTPPWMTGGESIKEQVTERRKLVKTLTEGGMNGSGEQKRFCDIIGYAERQGAIGKNEADQLRLVDLKGDACKYDQATWEQNVNIKLELLLHDVKKIVKKKQQQKKQRSSDVSASQQ